MSCANTFTQFPPFCHNPVSGIFSPAAMYALSFHVTIQCLHSYHFTHLQLLSTFTVTRIFTIHYYTGFSGFLKQFMKISCPYLLFIGTNLYISLLYPYQNRPAVLCAHPRNPLFFQSFQCFHMRMSIAVSFTAGDHCQFWRNLF